MKSIVAKMRADWPVIAENRRESGEWTEEDEKEIGLAVKEAIASNDPDLICRWARYLADLSALAIGLRVVTHRPGQRAQ